MPKKPAKKTVAKKSSTAAKKSVAKKSTAKKSTPRRVMPTKSVSTKSGYLVKEQEDFHRDHPNAFNLIAIFLILFMSLVMVYFYKNGLI